MQEPATSEVRGLLRRSGSLDNHDNVMLEREALGHEILAVDAGEGKVLIEHMAKVM